MSNVAMLDLIIGFISATFILPLIQQPKWSDQVRSWITFAYSVVVGVATVLVAGTFSLANLAASILLILVTAISTYKGFAKPVGVAPAIENATSPDQTPQQPGR